MAFLTLTPGHGGSYSSESFSSSSTTGADTIDCSNMSQLAIQIASSGAPAGNVDILHSFEGGSGQFVVLLADVPVTDGTVVRFTEADGPFGTLKIDATDVTAGSVVVKVVGFPQG